MVKNKLLSLGMAVVMALFTSVTAFAADTTINGPNQNGKYSSTVVATGSTTVPTINVTVPSSATFIVNPYNIQVSTDSLTELSDSDASLSVVSPTYTITSKSDIGLNVDITLQGTIPSGSGVVLSSKALTGKETTKSVFIYLEIKAKSDTFKGSYTKASNQVILSKSSTTKKSVCFIPAGTSSNPSEAELKFFGSAAANPKTAWSKSDTVKATIKFTFRPVAGTGL
jgi:hypothetical protein